MPLFGLYDVMSIFTSAGFSPFINIMLMSNGPAPGNHPLIFSAVCGQHHFRCLLQAPWNHNHITSTLSLISAHVNAILESVAISGLYMYTHMHIYIYIYV